MRSKDSSRNFSRGMTLVELILVMAILSVVMLAVMSLFIPAQRATVVQTQVTDIQANLRLAMDRLSQDLLTAGFLVADQPIVFDSGTNNDPIDFTIQTRIIGNNFGRVLSVSGNDLELSSSEMLNNFPVGTKVRLFNPVSMLEVEELTVVDPADRIYTVTAWASGKLRLDSVPAATTKEVVVVAVRDAAQPPLQTIRYQFVDSNGDGTRDALVRIANGNGQFLARNVSAVSFAYDYTPHGKVQRVDITLTGQTRALVQGDAIAGAKTRSLQSSVMLRNVF